MKSNRFKIEKIGYIIIILFFIKNFRHTRARARARTHTHTQRERGGGKRKKEKKRKKERKRKVVSALFSVQEF